MSKDADRVNAYMAMSPEDRAADDRKRLATMRRIVGKAIAHSMLSDDPSRRATGWHLAAALDDHDCEVEYPIRKALKELGADYEEVWVHPNVAPTNPRPPVRMDQLQAEIAQHIAGAYVSGSDDQVERARELETALDGLGLNVDRKVDSIVLEAMRRRPSDRGTSGRADSCPF